MLTRFCLYTGINQDDIDERNAQVALMRRIYKNALQVNVWLGEEADDSSLAIDLINKIGAPPMRGPGEKAIEYPTISEPEVHRHWKALHAIFQRPWWERSWIRQEVALATSIVVYCGNATTRLETVNALVHAVHYIESLGSEAPFPTKPNPGQQTTLPLYFHAEMLCALWDEAYGGYLFLELPKLLLHTKACKATDQRDKVFSILGLIDPEAYDLRADYHLPVKEVLVSAARTALQREDGLSILGACQNPGRKHGLPSWVPNLLDDWTSRPFQSKGRGLYVTHMPADLRFSNDTLTAAGFLYGTITSLCPTTVLPNASAADLDAVYEAWLSFTQDGRKKDLIDIYESETYVENETNKDAKWLEFLSINEYEERRDDGLDQPTPPANLNLRLTRAYLLPGGRDPERHPRRRILEALRKVGAGRRLGTTSYGKIGLFPAETVVGDWVGVIHGAPFAAVLRGVEEKEEVKEVEEEEKKEVKKEEVKKNEATQDEIDENEENKDKHTKESNKEDDKQESFVFVGEAFIPIYMYGAGEGFAKDDGIDINGRIRIV